MLPIHRVALALVVVAALALQLHILGETVSWTWARAIGFPIGAMGAILWIFDRWLWRTPFLQGWFVRRPNLNGSWNVVLKTGWIDPSTGIARGPVEAQFDVRQSHSRIHIEMSSAESKGSSVSAVIVRREDGRYFLSGIYRNEPNLTNRGSSQIHYGSFILDINRPDSRPTALRGHYWTDRDTKGEMEALRTQLTAR